MNGLNMIKVHGETANTRTAWTEKVEFMGVSWVKDGVYGSQLGFILQAIIHCPCAKKEIWSHEAMKGLAAI